MGSSRILWIFLIKTFKRFHISELIMASSWTFLQFLREYSPCNNFRRLVFASSAVTLRRTSERSENVITVLNSCRIHRSTTLLRVWHYLYLCLLYSMYFDLNLMWVWPKLGRNASRVSVVLTLASSTSATSLKCMKSQLEICSGILLTQVLFYLYLAAAYLVGCIFENEQTSISV